VRSIVDKLRMVKRPEVWGVYFRSSPIEVTEPNFRIMARAVLEWSGVEWKPGPSAAR